MFIFVIDLVGECLYGMTFAGFVVDTKSEGPLGIFTGNDGPLDESSGVNRFRRSLPVAEQGTQNISARQLWESERQYQRLFDTANRQPIVGPCPGND